MKVSDFIFQFQPNNYSHEDALCRVRVFVNEQIQFALLTDLGEKSGPTSVTNSVEYIRQQLVTKGFIYHDTIIIEHYEDKYSGYGTFDIVTFSNSNAPSWEKTTLEKTQKMLNCPHKELLDNSLKNKRLFEQIENLHQSLYPFTKKTYVEEPDVISKRLKIRNSTISKSELIDFIKNNPIERDISNFLRNDLSLFADLYAHPSEEYIVLPELMVGNGFVDFVVLSGRSRMDVTLIEIKGANFNLMNSSGYNNFSQKTNEAIQQVRERIGTIYRDYPRHREYFHKVREAVETGSNIHNALCGPKGKLSVSPDKDINIRTVVIAGRSKNDIEESKQRHNVEMTSSPPIRLESWDSLLNKLPNNR
ncbi:Shedu anti-phage system protein SduA domain-containing protein [Xenorhabdus thailandensis]|uniref:Shedu anti-phage system protein SduA domain-containing protein n=1 Tax=Xenorhabdus thailandensis TaxID=3136255 RepID=UPI0030F3EF82